MTDEKFHEFISNIAVKKYDESNEEWVCLKKKFQDPANAHSGFFASTFQKTKHNLTKLSNKAFTKEKESKMNSSVINLSCTKDGSPRRSSSLMSLGNMHSECQESEPNVKIGTSQSMQSLNSTIVDEQTKSVKEKAKELNRKNTEPELRLRAQTMPDSKSSLTKSSTRINKLVEVEYFDFSDVKLHLLNECVRMYFIFDFKSLVLTKKNGFWYVQDVITWKLSRCC